MTNVNDINIDASGDIQVDVKTMPSISIGTGTVKVSKILSTSGVTGTVSVKNFPATQAVTGSVSLIGTSPVTGNVTVKNFPATQAVTGSVSLVGTSPVTGTVSISSISTSALSNPLPADIYPLSIVKTGQITVGTTSKPLTSSCTSRCVSVEPHSANTGKVYIGDSSVTTSTGWELVAPISFDVNNANKIYVIANQANQKVCWAVLR